MIESTQDILNRLSLILTSEEISKIQTIQNGETQTLVLDVHGLTTKQAKRIINNLIALNRNAYNLQIIHGYNHGTAIKEMIFDIERLDNKRILKRTGNTRNLGITNLEIASA